MKETFGDSVENVEYSELPKLIYKALLLRWKEIEKLAVQRRN